MNPTSLSSACAAALALRLLLALLLTTSMPAFALNAANIAAGGYHSCAVTDTGTVECWGDNTYGQLGNASTSDSSTRVSVVGLSGVTALAAGEYHSCALLGSGQVKCWGYNQYGQLGNGNNTNYQIPTNVSSISNAVDITAGWYHTCALLSDGSIKCWGNGDWGKLGNGTTIDSNTPVPVAGITNGAGIAAGWSHTCALLTDGSATCWGRNYYGQLGTGSDTYEPRQVAEISTAVAIAAGDEHSCALLESGSAKCWGRNNFGQLGDGTTTNTTSPVSVAGLSDAVKLAASGDHSCAITNASTVKCWGDNENGQLGNGNYANSSNSTTVTGVLDAQKLALGFNHSCVVIAEGKIQCWGANDQGQLGDGVADYYVVPTPAAFSGYSKISSGSSVTCGIKAGEIHCWGYNGSGQLGTGASSPTSSASPLPVIGIANATDVAAGGLTNSHVCAVESGSVKCWGEGSSGQLGNGTTGSFLAPQLASGITTAVSVSAGGYFTCAVLANQTVQCWGDNYYGQLGDGTNTDKTIPTGVSGLGNVAQVAAGYQHACAVLTDGSVKCWGNNSYKQLGNNSTSSINIPILVTGVAGAVAVSAGDKHTCALLGNGRVTCWGTFWGDTNYNPSEMANVADAVAVASGESHACALLSGGAMKCWGYNDRGQLGNGAIAYSKMAPTSVTAIMNASYITARRDHTCALTGSSGTLQCWGEDFSHYGYLGKGSNNALPVWPIDFGALTAPSSPTNVGAVGGYASIDVSFSSALTGSEPILYNASCVPFAGGIAITQTGASSPLRVAPLAVGVQHNCSVVAFNDVGTSAASSISPATPTAGNAPGAPILTRVRGGNGSLTLYFTPPLPFDGPAVDHYTASCTPATGGATVSASGNSSPITVDGLVTGMRYNCTVTASNGIGTSPTSVSKTRVARNASGISAILNILME